MTLLARGHFFHHYLAYTPLYGKPIFMNINHAIILVAGIGIGLDIGLFVFTSENAIGPHSALADTQIMEGEGVPNATSTNEVQVLPLKTTETEEELEREMRSELAYLAGGYPLYDLFPATTGETIDLLFVGDVMPSRFVAKKMADYGYAYPLKDTRDIISSADLAFANLESPVTEGRTIEVGEMVFRTDPEFLPYFREAGFDIVSLANNHAPNFGEKGLRDTFVELKKNSIAWVGAGTSGPAYLPRVIEAKGVKIGFVAVNDPAIVPPEYCATDNRVGTACYDDARMKAAIMDIRSSVDIVVFTFHGGYP